MQYPRTLLTAVSLGLLAAALPALAASGDVASIGLRDLNRNGKIDLAVITFANPAGSVWTVRGASGFGVAYNGTALKIKGAFMASTANPAVLEVVLDETDPHLPVDTAAAKFEVTYHRVGNAVGVSDGASELAAIASGDTNASDTELDQAPPILTASTPAPGAIDYLRTNDLTLTFSEPVLASSLVPSSSSGVGGWSFTSIGDGRTVTAQHDAYPRGANEAFGIAGNDLAGNALVTDAYPNPFTFQTSITSTPNPRIDSVYQMTSPAPGATLFVGDANVLGWYDNTAAAATRLSYSKDGGQTWTPIATLPAPQNTYVWYPPSLPSIQLRAEALGANGSVVNVSTVNPLSLQPGSGTTVPIPDFAAPAAAPDAHDVTAPEIVGPAVLDSFDAAAGTARLSWTTDEPSTASVNYGAYLNYGRLASDAALATSHSILLSGLTPGKLHQARITLIDASGNASVSKDWYFVFLRENDLIKGSGPAVYWYKGGKRSAFPNFDVYQSWYGKDFSKVLVVPDTQLGTIALGGNVKMKEGVYLIKIQSDPKTYAVEPNGVLRWIQTEAQAKALYGAAWATRVRDVDVSLFTDYTIGAPLADGEKPAGYKG